MLSSTSGNSPFLCNFCEDIKISSDSEFDMQAEIDVCSRCVRACEEVQGTFALTVQGRGFDSRITPGGTDFLASECVSCGACVQACPTGTLQEKSVAEIGTPDRSVITTCAYCGVGCGVGSDDGRGDGAGKGTGLGTGDGACVGCALGPGDGTGMG